MARDPIRSTDNLLAGLWSAFDDAARRPPASSSWPLNGKAAASHSASELRNRDGAAGAAATVQAYLADTGSSGGPAAVPDASIETGSAQSSTGDASQPIPVTGGASVEIDGASTQSVAFSGTTGTLKLDDAVHFTGHVAGLQGSDALDLVDVNYGAKTTASFMGNSSGGTLTVSDGTNTAHISLVGDYLKSGWTLSSDGHGGTVVVDPPLSATDGSASAPAGTPQLPSLLSGYAARPSWNVAGLDYAVGIPAGTVLKDPTTINMAGVTVDARAHEVHIAGNNVTLSGYDFSGGGGWTVYVDSGTNVTIENSNFLVGSNHQDPIFVSAPASNVSILNNVIDGAGLLNYQIGQGLIEGDGLGNVTIEYNVIKNAYSEDIVWGNNTVGATQNIAIQYNLVQNAGLGGNQGAHGDWIQLVNSPGANANSVTIDYNTWMQTVPFAQGHTQGLSLYSANSGSNSGGVQTEAVENNTFIVAPGGLAGAYVNYAIIMDTSRLMGTGTIANNYFDPTGIGTPGYGGSWDYVGNYDDANGGPYNGTVTSSNNVNMLTGTSIDPSQPLTTPTPPPPPTAPVISADTVNGDAVTLKGTAAANSTVTVLDGTTRLGTSTTNGSGAWTFTTGALTVGTHSFTATATDAAGTSVASAAFSQSIGAAPAITSIAESPSTGDLNAGKTVTFTLSMSSAVTVTGTPTLTLNDGGTASYASGSGTKALTFTYTVGSSDTHVSSLAANSVNLPSGATIKDSSGNSASLALAGLIQTGPQIDATSPSVSSVTPSGTGITVGAGDLGAGSVVTLTVKLSEVVTVGGAPTLSLNDGGTATYVNGSGTNALTFSYKVSSSDSAVSALAVTGVNLPSGATIKDAAGNAANLSGAETTFSGLKIDLAGATPAVPVISSFSPDTGKVGDGITDANQLDLKGTADPNSTITVYDGLTELGTTTANAAGSWDYITSILTDAKHVLTAIETNQSGQSSAASVPLTVTVDTHVPAAPILLSDAIVDTNHVQLSGTAEPNSSITVYDGTTVVGTGATSATGAWSITTAALMSGPNDLTATATDVAGTTSAISQAMDPVIPVASKAPSAPKIVSFSPDTGAAESHITNADSVTLSGTAVGGSTVDVFDGTEPIGTTTADGNGNWSLETPDLIDGNHSLTATDTDASGLTSVASNTFSLSIDTHQPAAPTMTAYSPGGAAVRTTTALHDLVLKGTAEANSKIDIFDDEKLIGTVTTSKNGTWSFDTGHLGTGDHVFASTATDAAGTTSPAEETEITVTQSKSVEFTSLSENCHHVATIKGVAAADSEVKLFNGSASLGMVKAADDGSWSFTTGLLSSKTQVFTAAEVDNTGQTIATSSGEAVLGSTHGHSTLTSSPDDLLVGNGHSNTFVFAANFGNDVIQDFVASGKGHDTIRFSKSVFDNFDSVLSHASQAGQSVVISIGNDTLTLKDTKLSALNSHDFHFV